MLEENERLQTQHDYKCEELSLVKESVKMAHMGDDEDEQTKEEMLEKMLDTTKVRPIIILLGLNVLNRAANFESEVLGQISSAKLSFHSSQICIAHRIKNGYHQSTISTARESLTLQFQKAKVVL